MTTSLVDSRNTRQWTDEQAVTPVQLITLAGATGGDFTLPGDIQAFTTAAINAQVSGTIQKWFVDIGAPVKQGQILAQIDPRTYEAALAQARGQLARDAATLANARVDLTCRYQTLAAQNAISAQQLATQQATVAADAGVVETDRAAVQAAQINLGYTRVVAPFAGTVTSRSIDVGQLVTANTTTATPMFTVTDQSRLRIYVRMPQNYSFLVRPGMTASFTVPEYPGRTFTATLAASAGAITSQSGTQLIQMQVDNSDHALKPGSYAEVRFSVPKATAPGRARAGDSPDLPRQWHAGGHAGARQQGCAEAHPHRHRPGDIRGNRRRPEGGRQGDRTIPPDLLQAGDVVRVTGRGDSWGRKSKTPPVLAAGRLSRIRP